MSFLTYNTRTVLLGVSLLGACSGLVGSYAVLRRRALTGDALAHAALPGVCLAFMVFGQKTLPVLLLGAFVTGTLGVMVVTALRSATRIKEDAAIGIVLSVFFGAGIVLSTIIQHQYQNTTGLESFILGSTDEMLRQDVLLIGGVSAFCLLLVAALYKEFKLIVFDPGFARVQGWPSHALDLALMGMIALTVVIGLPAVGVVMVAALLILPSAAARFWTERFEVLLVLSCVFGGAIGSVGTLASAYFRELPAGPVIVLVGSGLFLLSTLLGPHRGVIARTIQESRFRRRIAEQKLFRAIHRRVGVDPSRAFTVADLASEPTGSPVIRPTLHRMRQKGWIEPHGSDAWRLTEAGRVRAAELVRAVQLWELLANEYPDLISSYADLDVESIREHLDPELLNELERRLNFGRRDFGRPQPAPNTG